jgi:2-desacetyl-2-hydroxyethyl bacteriochlorophyllide A dehydrogenase
MKAVVCDRIEKLKFRDDLPVPSPAPDQVLIRVMHTGFCGSDHSLIESGGVPDGYVVGHEVSGVIEDMGAEVTGHRAGERIMIRPTFCGLCGDCSRGRPHLCTGGRRTIGIGDLHGGFAEYLTCFPEMLIAVPDRVDSRNAALAEAFAASLHAIRVSRAESGSALVIGGGPIGLALLRLLKILGFGPVALSEPVQAKRDLAAGFGADILVDPHKENIVMHAMQGGGYETVFECSGAKDAVPDAMSCCANGGTVCVVSMIMRNIEIIPMVLNFKEIRLTGSYSNTHEENRQCLDWMAKGLLDGRPMISDEIPLEDLPRVYRERVDTGLAVKVMLAVGG